MIINKPTNINLPTYYEIIDISELSFEELERRENKRFLGEGGFNGS